MSALGGVCSGGVLSWPGGCLVLGGCLLRVVSGPRGESGLGSGVVSQHALRQTPPVDRITDACKNITLGPTSLRPVTLSRIVFVSEMLHCRKK